MKIKFNNERSQGDGRMTTEERALAVVSEINDRMEEMEGGPVWDMPNPPPRTLDSEISRLEIKLSEQAMTVRIENKAAEKTRELVTRALKAEAERDEARNIAGYVRDACGGPFSHKFPWDKE